MNVADVIVALPVCPLCGSFLCRCCAKSIRDLPGWSCMREQNHEGKCSIWPDPPKKEDQQ